MCAPEFQTPERARQVKGTSNREGKESPSKKKFCARLESPLKSPEFAVPELHRASKELG